MRTRGQLFQPFGLHILASQAVPPYGAVVIASVPARQLTFALTLLAATLQAGCGLAGNPVKHGSGSSGSTTISVSPSSSSVRVNMTQAFSAAVTGSCGGAITWQVNAISGGNSSLGTIAAQANNSSEATYTAPAVVPATNTVTVTALCSAASGTGGVAILNPTPVVNTVTPSSFATGSFTLTLAGSSFVNGAQVVFNGSTPLATTFISSMQLTATGTASAPGTYGISVTNPQPGSSSSAAVNVQVTGGQSGGGGGGGGTALACSVMSAGEGGSLNRFVPFDPSSLWNQDISSASVDPNSANIINFIGSSDPVHPDFGAGLYNGSSIGIPYSVVDSQQGFVNVTFNAYGDESDPGPMPIPSNAEIEGYPAPGNGDRHVLTLDNNNCWLYELYGASVNSDGSWNAGSAAVWDLLGNEQRPWTWTSADAAGLPIFPGLVRYDEVASGAIPHALRFTLQNSRAAFTPPASHWASNSSNQYAAPMGMRMRLKASFDISGYSAANQVILTALKKYGMIMADNGSNMYISGAPDDRWSNDDLHNLANLTASDFEVVTMNPVYTSANVPTGAAPSISSFTASPTSTSAASPVTLSWTVSGTSYLIVTPQIGAVRGSSVSVTPTATTTYTLIATNPFGRSTQNVTVNVQ
jgi:hypothetical protein